MTPLFHLTTPDAWQAALQTGTYREPSLDTEGFIHLSTDAQWPLTLRRFFPDHKGLVLLVIDSSRLADVRFERVHGDDFPHLYGPLPCEAVVEIRPIPAGS